MSTAGHWQIRISDCVFNMDTLVTMWIVMFVLILFAIISTKKLSIIPTKMQVVSEWIMGFFTSTVESMVSNNGRVHVPLLSSLFLFIVTANLIGQLPWRILHLKTGELASPTNDINMTASMSVLVLIYYVYNGIKVKGIKYFLHSFKPIDIIVALIELLEMVIRPFTLALRLFANILAGELLVVAFVGIFAYILPLPIMLFEVFVGFVQALVFMMLSTAYVSLATDCGDNEH